MFSDFWRNTIVLMELNCAIGPMLRLRLIADILLVGTAVVVSRKTKTCSNGIQGFEATWVFLFTLAGREPSSLNEKHVAAVQNSRVFQRGPCRHLFLVCTAEILELAVGRPGADKGLFFWRLWGGGARWRLLFWGNREWSVDVAVTGWFCFLFLCSRLIIFNKRVATPYQRAGEFLRAQSVNLQTAFSLRCAVYFFMEAFYLTILTFFSQF